MTPRPPAPAAPLEWRDLGVPAHAGSEAVWCFATHPPPLPCDGAYWQADGPAATEASTQTARRLQLVHHALASMTAAATTPGAPPVVASLWAATVARCKAGDATANVDSYYEAADAAAAVTWPVLAGIAVSRTITCTTRAAIASFPGLAATLATTAERAMDADSVSLRIAAGMRSDTLSDTTTAGESRTGNDIRREQRGHLSEYCDCVPRTHRPSSMSPAAVLAALPRRDTSDAAMAALPSAPPADGRKSHLRLAEYLQLHAARHLCDASACPQARGIASWCLACDLVWSEGSEPTTASPAPPPAGLSADDATIAAQIDKLLHMGVVEKLTPAEAADPTSSPLQASVFLASAMRLTTTDATAAAVEHYTGSGGDPTELLRVATDVADGIAARLRAEVATGKSPIPAFTAATAGLYEQKKPRLVFDGRRQSSMAPPIPFTLPTADKLMQRVAKGSLVGTVDLASGFYHVVMSAKARRWLTFAHEGTVYRHLRLPMGISIAPIVFCLLSAEVTAILRARGIKVLVTYIDDIIFQAASVEDAHAAMLVITETLKMLGIELAEDKTRAPATSQTALGLTIHTGTMTIGPSPDKLINNTANLMLIRSIAEGARGGSSRVPAAFITQTVARLGWQSAVTSGGDAHMRSLWNVYTLAQQHPTVDIARHWGSIRHDVAWWIQASTMRGSCALAGLHGRALRGGRVLVASDASLTKSITGGRSWGAFGGIVYVDGKPASAIWGAFNPKTVGDGLSTTAAEVYGSLATLVHASTAVDVKGKLVCMATDNLGAAHILNSGRCTRESERKYARCGVRLAADKGFDHYSVFWPRQINSLADALTKAQSRDRAQLLLDAACDAAGVDRIPVFHAPSFRILQSGAIDALTTCSHPCKCSGAYHPIRHGQAS